MSGLEPPAFGTPGPRLPAPPAGAMREFEARHQRREAGVVVLVGGIGLVIVGTGVVLMAGLVSSEGLLGDEATAAEPGVFRILLQVMLALFVVFGAVLAGKVVSGLVRALRRALILRIDADGVTLERRRWWRRDRFIPWNAVRGLSAYSTTRRDDDGPSTAHWFQVDLTDGTIQRWPLDRHRYSWAALAEVVRAVAPRMALSIEGESPSRGGS
jgi:hypothetical protein